jgi:diaminohydroxyphosphoribosylaminopyrimidine deaminase/5-amino-6-(5-phosphoribosylamino)uracil reductase
MKAKTPVTGSGIDDISLAKEFELRDLQNIDGDIFAHYIRKDDIQNKEV